MTRSRFIKIAIAVAALLSVVVYLFMRTVHASYGYRVKCEFSIMPSNDSEIRRWLRVQPGVVAHTVATLRTNNTLKVGFIMSRDMTGRPLFPKLDEQCQVLGYKRISAGFHDCLGPEREEAWHLDYDPLDCPAKPCACT
jgi:hypothetical protein